MSEPVDPYTGYLFRRVVLLEIDRLLHEYPGRWSSATVKAVVASKDPVDVNGLFDLLDRVQLALLALPRPPDSD